MYIGDWQTYQSGANQEQIFKSEKRRWKKLRRGHGTSQSPHLTDEDLADIDAREESEGIMAQPSTGPPEQEFDGAFRDIDPSQISPHATQPDEFNDIRPIGTFDTAEARIPQQQPTQTPEGSEPVSEESSKNRGLLSSLAKLGDMLADFGKAIIATLEPVSHAFQQRKKPLSPVKIGLPLGEPLPEMRDHVETAVGVDRWLDRYAWFRWLRAHPWGRKLSGGGGVVVSLLIAKQALDYEISGAIKTAAFAFLIAWSVFAFAIYVSNIWDKRRLPMSAALVLTGAVLLFVWLAYLPLPPMPPNPQRSASIATSPIPTPTTATNVTPQAQTSDDKQRIFIDVKPEYLIGLYKKYSTAQANQAVKTYIGKWVKISGEVVDVDQDANWDALTGRVDPSVMITTKIPADYFHTHCRFEEQRSIDRALVLRRGEKITLLGRISRINEQSFSLEKCYFGE